ncbi:hypothetical protein GNY06_07530 [Elizabethkingia argentiflava]|uniref:Uncharacterized protein n=1 Tax=Elizabethkingia argenteiflava TaxID=2681556 RepID=A0A845PSM8_9FLAO|nr:hypothetical protein [Elizabethkingia argenteiflava]NAW51232.1 hypothetical protein [Elizabethkingia argenteiflava]
MKKLFIGLLFLLICKVQGQTFEGIVYIKDNTAAYLNQIYVTNLNTRITILADYRGGFRIPAQAGDTIRFTSVNTERKDLQLPPQYLRNKKMLIELSVAYREIQELVIHKFKPTGNFKVDVLSTKQDKRIALTNKIGLPSPKEGFPQAPIASLNNGSVQLNIQSVFDIITGERKKQERLYAYEMMLKNVKQLHNYYGDNYFTQMKIPKNLISNFLEFVYTSDDLGRQVKEGNYPLIEMSIQKYLPIYLKRLHNSSLQTLGGKQ